MYLCMYIHIYKYTYVCMYIYIYVPTYVVFPSLLKDASLKLVNSDLRFGAEKAIYINNVCISISMIEDRKKLETGWCLYMYV
jgi:hypothetical protein